MFLIIRMSTATGDKSQKDVQYKWWIQISVYSTFILCGQAIGTLLGKLYFNKGGNNIWLASLVQNIGFPILIPSLLLSSTNNNKILRQEMDKFELGKKLYVLNLIGTAISWQVFSVGSTGLIFKVSSLVSNIISILGVPMAPVFCVLFLHEKMSGVKVNSMFLAMWSFLSYMYQHYL